MEVFAWVEHCAQPRPGTTAGLIYDHMDSQSGKALPIIYRPFDPDDPVHTSARGMGGPR